MKKLVVSVTLQIGIITLGSMSAFAYRGDGTLAMIRQETRSSIVKIEGSLSCRMGSQNTGEPCALKIEENGTGRVYSLRNSNEAMRIYQSGTKSVSIEGKFSDAETLDVASVSKL